MKTSRACIIGCGPAGLFAAEACRQQGWNFNILAPKKSMSTIGGAQYLHRSIPEITSERPNGTITYVKIGQRDIYAMKVYGNMAMDVSWDTFDDGDKPFWSLSEAYVRAWLRHSENIRPAALQPQDIRNLHNSYDLVINTAPKNKLCLQSDRHKFSSQEVFIKNNNRQYHGHENRIVYNGQPSVPWYRWSLINGVSSYEYSNEPQIKGEGRVQITRVHKPLLNDCNCHPYDNYVEVGRYGRWRKGALTHEAYFMTMEAIDAM